MKTPKFFSSLGASDTATRRTPPALRSVALSRRPFGCQTRRAGFTPIATNKTRTYRRPTETANGRAHPWWVRWKAWRRESPRKVRMNAKNMIAVLATGTRLLSADPPLPQPNHVWTSNFFTQTRENRCTVFYVGKASKVRKIAVIMNNTFGGRLITSDLSAHQRSTKSTSTQEACS